MWRKSFHVGSGILKSLLRQIRLLLEMIRFSHTVFALPFALLAVLMAWKLMPPQSWELKPNDAGGSGSAWWAAWSSWGRPLLGVLLCMVGARSAAMAFNRIVDRQIDANNPRTAQRHLPRGDLSLGTAWAFTLASIAVFLLGTLLFWPNWLPLALALPVLSVLLGYSLAKRFTVLAHYWLGFALMLAPICAWVAIRGPALLDRPAEWGTALTLGVAIFFWVGGFDIIYACQDEVSDRAAELYSIPAWLGAKLALQWAAISHFFAWLCFLALGWIAPAALELSWLYFGTVGLIGILLAYQHSLVRPDDLSRVNIAFFNVNAVISLGVLVATTVDMWVV
jgi:4-hydroxybenzoate polyprenyltransferase